MTNWNISLFNLTVSFILITFLLEWRSRVQCHGTKQMFSSSAVTALLIYKPGQESKLRYSNINTPGEYYSELADLTILKMATTVVTMQC